MEPGIELVLQEPLECGVGLVRIIGVDSLQEVDVASGLVALVSP